MPEKGPPKYDDRALLGVPCTPANCGTEGYINKLEGSVPEWGREKHWFFYLCLSF